MKRVTLNRQTRLSPSVAHPEREGLLVPNDVADRYEWIEPLAEDALEVLTVEALKAICRQFDVPVSGTKDEILGRLRAL